MDLPFSPSQLESLYALLSHINKFYTYNHDSGFFDQVLDSQPLSLPKLQLIDIEHVRYLLTQFTKKPSDSPAQEPNLHTIAVLSRDQINLLSKLITLVLQIHFLDARSEFYIKAINKFLYDLSPAQLFLLHDLDLYFAKQKLPF